MVDFTLVVYYDNLDANSDSFVDLLVCSHIEMVYLYY